MLERPLDPRASTERKPLRLYPFVVSAGQLDPIGVETVNNQGYYFTRRRNRGEPRPEAIISSGMRAAPTGSHLIRLIEFQLFTLALGQKAKAGNRAVLGEVEQGKKFWTSVFAGSVRASGMYFSRNPAPVKKGSERRRVPAASSIIVVKETLLLPTSLLGTNQTVRFNSPHLATNCGVDEEEVSYLPSFSNGKYKLQAECQSAESLLIIDKPS